MRDYSRKIRELGFHVLSYFNVTEFGADVVFPAPARKAKSDADLCKDCNDFLYAKLADAILITPEGEKAHHSGYGPTRPGCRIALGDVRSSTLSRLGILFSS
jgi:hypothetical protein